MAAQVEVQAGEVGRPMAGGRLHLSPLSDSSNKSIEIPHINQSHIITPEPNKPAPAPKPRLTPKPFAVDKNPTIKPILAPKPQPKPRPESTRLVGSKPELPSSPKPQQPVPPGKPKPISTNLSRPAPTTFKTSNKLNTGQIPKPTVQPLKSAPSFGPEDLSKPTPLLPAERKNTSPKSLAYSRSLKKFPVSEWPGSTKKEDDKDQGTSSKVVASITRAKSMGSLNQVCQEVEDEKEKPKAVTSVSLRPKPRTPRPRPVSAIFVDNPTKTETPVPAPRWGGRRPLSTDLTSKFESIGLSLHRKPTNANIKENTPEAKAQKTPTSVPAEKLDHADKPAFSDQSEINAKEKTVKETNENKTGGSIKSRISLLLDSSSSPATGATGPGSDLNSPVPAVSETESPVDVKLLIKQLTEDTTPTPSPITKPALRPRPLPLDLTKRFSTERSPDLGSTSLSEAPDHHEIGRDPERRTEETAVTPSDQWIVDITTSQEQLKKAPTPKESKASQLVEDSHTASDIKTVRASLFENVVERHSVVVVEESKSVNNNLLRSQSLKKENTEDGGTLVTATYKEPIAPSSPLQVIHAFDTVQAVEENRAVSENIPTAQWEDKAMTLRSRRSEGSRPATEITSSAPRDPALALTPEQHPRYLRVGALQKWTTSEFDKDAGISSPQRESKREVAFDMDRDKQKEAEQEELAGEPKRLKRQAEEQPKPKATYFALTAQIQEPVSPSESGVKKGSMTSLLDDFSVGSLLASSQGKILSVRRNPSLEEAFGKTFQSQDEVEDSAMRGHMTHKEMKSVFHEPTIDEMMEVEKTMDVKMKERLLLDEQEQFARMKEREMQREFERQRQRAFEKEMEEREQQRQIELEKQRLQELEREKQKRLERERQNLELERLAAMEKEKMRKQERERQRQREEERQRELDREKQLLDIQKEKQKREEQERQMLLDFEKQKQKEKERQQALELEQHRQREKMEREEAEKMKQIALEQEMLRLKELDKERERQREIEKEHQKELERENQRQLEKQRQIDLEKERQRKRDLKRQELENQRLRQLELDKERQRKELEELKEMERRQLLEFEKKKRAEELEKCRQREEAEKMRQIAKQHEAERKRLKEQERAKSESSPLRPKVLDLDLFQTDPFFQSGPQRSDPSTRRKELSPRTDESYRPSILDIDSFTTQTQLPPNKDLFPVSNPQGVDPFGNKFQPKPERDFSPKVPLQTSVGFLSPVWTPPQDPWEMCSNEMSVDQPMANPKKLANKSPDQLLLRQEERQPTPQMQRSTLLDDFDPFSPTKVDNTSVAGSSSIVPAEMIWLPREPQRQDSRKEIQKQRRSQGSQELNRMRSRSVSRRSAPQSSTLEGNLPRIRSRSAHRELDRNSWVQEKQSVRDEKDVNDSETPVHDTDSQYGTWETGLRTDDSLTPATPSSESNLSPSPRKPTTPQTPGDHGPRSESDPLDALLPSSEDQPLSFPDAPTTLLDTSVLRSRAQLGKKRAPRTRPSRAARQSAALTEEDGGTPDDWLYRDSTEAKVETKDEDSDSEEQIKQADVSPAVASQPQRVALFPGMDPSALKAQLKKRGDSESQVDGSTPSRTPKSPFLPRAARVLPTPGGKDNGEENSPQWLKELKSKKRLSQYESES